MPLTSECPGWSSISQEASIPAGHMAEFVLPQLHTTSHLRTRIPQQMLCHSSRVARPLTFLAAAAVTSQEGIPHQTLEGKTQSTPQPAPVSPQNVEGKMPGCILLAVDPGPTAASWGGTPRCSPPQQALTSLREPADPALPTACPHRRWCQCCPAPACTSVLTQCYPQPLPPTHCPGAAHGLSSTGRLE